MKHCYRGDEVNLGTYPHASIVIKHRYVPIIEHHCNKDGSGCIVERFEVINGGIPLVRRHKVIVCVKKNSSRKKLHAEYCEYHDENCQQKAKSENIWHYAGDSG